MVWIAGSKKKKPSKKPLPPAGKNYIKTEFLYKNNIFIELRTFSRDI